MRSTCVLLLLMTRARAHDSHAQRSFGGVHDGATTLARRAALRAALAAEPRVVQLAREGACNWTHSSGGYWEACGGAAGNVGSFSRLTPAAAQDACCANTSCKGFSYDCTDASCATGSGYYKGNLDCGFINSAVQGYAQPSALPIMPVVNVTVSPDTPLTADVVNVTVSFVFVTGSVNRSSDWVGQVCVGSPIEDYIEFVPVDFMAGWNTSTGGSFVFSIFRTRCDYEFRYFRGSQPLWPTGQAVGVSAPVTWTGQPWGSGVPFHAHLAYGGEDTQHAMVVSFTTNSTPGGDVTVMVGTAPGVYDLGNATDVESTTYGAGDLCNAPANETSVDYWQWPGVFHHVTLRDLTPGTRYYARPVAGEFVGEELTFVTGKQLGPDVPITFAAYGDMSVTQYVLDGDTRHDMPNGGPGAVGTSQRLRDRIDLTNDVDFVVHFGDLGYATGAVYLWDAWMSMMANVGSRVPYMVSIGNHEYDYRYPSANDPSGVSGGVHEDMPTWFDGDVDSRGECGVGTERRFRAPASPGSNKIFWYAFSSGSITIITLSSEHSVAPGSPQRAFLETALGSVNRSVTPWLMVTFHRQVYSFTGAEQAVQDGYLAWMEDLFYAHKVDLVANGHIHQSQRTVPLYRYAAVDDAPVYIISGSAGAMLEPYAATNTSGVVAFNGLGVCGFYVVSCVNASHMRLTWSRNNDSAVLDDAWVVRQGR